jgi:hypothetical protein
MTQAARPMDVSPLQDHVAGRQPAGGVPGRPAVCSAKVCLLPPDRKLVVDYSLAAGSAF